MSGKRYRKTIEGIDANKAYAIDEAVKAHPFVGGKHVDMCTVVFHVLDVVAK